jgi:hypothetical protein
MEVGANSLLSIGLFLEVMALLKAMVIAVVMRVVMAAVMSVVI